VELPLNKSLSNQSYKQKEYLMKIHTTVNCSIVTASLATALALCLNACALDPTPDDSSQQTADSEQAADPESARSLLGGSTQNNTSEVEVVEVPNATSADCPAGEICFYTKTGLRGHMCKWGRDDPDWAGGNIRCSWATTKNVCSVWNRSRGNVEYFTAPNFSSRIGSTDSGAFGKLQCSYKLRSHRCSTSGACW
jgi:hypothetical protein